MYRDVGHGSLDRIQDIAVWGVRQGSTLACSHRCPKGLRLIVDLRPFGDDLVASIGIDHHVHACRIESLQLSQRLLTPSASQYDYTHRSRPRMLSPRTARKTERRIRDLAFSLDSIPDVSARQNRKTLTLSFGEDADKLFAGWEERRNSYYIRYKAESRKPNQIEKILQIFESLPQKDGKPDCVKVNASRTIATIYSGESVAAVNANCRRLCALLEPICLENSLNSSKAALQTRNGLSHESYYKEIATLIKLCTDNKLAWPLANWRQTYAFDLVDELATVGSTSAAFQSAGGAYREHVVPLNLVHRHAVKLGYEGASVDAIANFLLHNLLLVKISTGEAEHLNRSPGGTGGKTLKESMPDGWEWGDDPIERLKAVGINVSLNRPIPRWEPWTGKSQRPGIRSRLKAALMKKLF